MIVHEERWRGGTVALSELFLREVTAQETYDRHRAFCRLAEKLVECGALTLEQACDAFEIKMPNPL